jgi:hypothetical protein
MLIMRGAGLPGSAARAAGKLRKTSKRQAHRLEKHRTGIDIGVREKGPVRVLVLLGIDVLSVKIRKMLKKSVFIGMPTALREVTSLIIKDLHSVL